jgi:hypothetical protein
VSDAATYLGDGLYAEDCGHMIVLRAPRERSDHWVGLEPEVFLELLRFARSRGWGDLIDRECKEQS